MIMSMSDATQVKETRPDSSVSFDAGINASSAWAEALESSSNNGDAVTSPTQEGPASDDDEPPPRSARALYDFEGKSDFRELYVGSLRLVNDVGFLSFPWVESYEPGTNSPS